MRVQPKARQETGPWRSPRKRSLLLLAIAFGGLLIVIAASSYAVWRSSTTAQKHEDDQRLAHLQSRNALGLLRANVYLIGILTRDYLLDPGPANAEIYLQQFRTIKDQTEGAFGVLEQAAQTDQERSALQLLRMEIETNWDPGTIILSWRPGKQQPLADVMRERLRQRKEIVALAESLEGMITEDFASESARLTMSDKELQRTLGWIIGIAFLLTFGVAGVTFFRLFALRHHSQMAESELRLLSGQLRTAQEEERKRLSRELHDQVGQMLTGLRMELGLIARLNDSTRSEFPSRIARAKATAEQTLEVVRNIAMLLRPSMLDDLGLKPALTWLANEMSRSSGIAIRLEIGSKVDELPERHRTCMYRVIQEALTNVVRHSSASVAEVTLKSGLEWITATIADNGQGFEEGRARGLGMLGMEERVRELGGTIRIVTSRNEGARIEISLPNPNGVKEE